MQFTVKQHFNTNGCLFELKRRKRKKKLYGVYVREGEELNTKILEAQTPSSSLNNFVTIFVTENVLGNSFMKQL